MQTTGRKGINVNRSSGRLTGVRQVAKGSLYANVELIYRVEGCAGFSTILTAYAHMPRVDVTVRVHKETHWDAENLYIAIPFRKRETGKLWLNKANIGGFYEFRYMLSWGKDMGSEKEALQRCNTMNLGILCFRI